MNILNKKILGEKFPSFLIHIYYFLVSCTFCYIYSQKFMPSANFHAACDGGGIYAVLNGIACKPVQLSILIPYLFKVVSLITFLNDKLVFVLTSVIITYFILLSFYALLNCFFRSKAHNCWLAPIIIYPMIWNYIILNGQFFFVDFCILLITVLGFYFIVREQYILLLLTFFIGALNHLTVGYLLIAFLLYNYKSVFKPKFVFKILGMLAIYISVYLFLNFKYSSNEGYMFSYTLPNNLGVFKNLSVYILLRDILFNFGGLHFFLIIFILSGQWKKFRRPMLYINFIIVFCILIVFILFTVNDIRNYIAAIPFIVVSCLLYLSNFENSFLRPTESLVPNQ